MKEKKTIASLFLSIILVVVGTPIATIDSSLALKTASAAPSCSQFGNLNPITDLSLISALAPPPEGATYACGEINLKGGFIYHFFDANDKPIGNIIKPNSTDFTGHTYVTDSSGKVINDIGAPAYCDFENDWGPFFDAGCWMQFLGALISSLFLSLGIVILEIAGYLFNYLLENTIIQFSTAIYDKIASAIETAWTAFRDIANILIIGIFTFIALSIILGLKEFGQKKLIANVLIIAVLINFSLLFTKMIIDASNFTALQFYNAALGQVSNTAGPSISIETGKAGAESKTGAIVESSSKGISGQFMQAIGITGVANSLEQIRAEQKRTDSGLLGIAFGLLAFIFFVGAAVVLFYGSFLLIARVVLLIFLMITSSLAFASYLVPKWAGSSYGWSTWWSSLLKSAVFAPMLMLFLWITLQIADALMIKTKGVTLGGVVDKPDGNVAAVFSYLIILGLLFLSFKLSSTFAGKISGFNLASIATALPLTLGSRLGGLVLRNAPGWGGRGSARRALGLDDEIDKQKEAARNAKGTPAEYKEYKKLETLMRGKQRAETRAGSSFNLMNTAAAKATMAGLGVSGFAAGANAKVPSFAESSNARAAKAAKEASGLALSQDEKNKIRETAINTKVEEKRRYKEKLKLDKEAHEKEYALKKEETETKEQTLRSNHERETRNKESLAKKHESILKAVAEDVARATDDKTREAHDKKYKDTENAQKNEMQEQDNKIKDINTHLQAVTAPADVVKKKLDDVNKELEGLSDENILKNAQKQVASERVVEKAEENARDMATKVGAGLAYSSFTSTLQKMVGIDPSKDTVAGKKAFKEIKKKIRAKKTTDMLTALNEATGDAADTATKGDSGGSPAGGTH